jgi:hypothetical protein
LEEQVIITSALWHPTRRQGRLAEYLIIRHVDFVVLDELGHKPAASCSST